MFANTLPMLIMNRDVPGIIRKLRSYWRMKKKLEEIRFHSGRTDGDGGHHDLKNVSGLGYYHYHHGLGPHLHPCPYGQQKRASLVTLLKKNGAVLSTANIGTAEEPKYLFEAVIEVYPNALWLKLQFGARNQYVDGFYLYGYMPKTLVEPFWGTPLNPELVIVDNSPWKGATGYIDILVDEAYFYTIIEKFNGVSEPGDPLIIPGKQLLSDNGIEFLGKLETEGSPYNVYGDNNVLIGILSADIGDGGITYGFGHYISYTDFEKQGQLFDAYGLKFEVGIFVPIDICVKIKHNDVNFNKIDNVKSLDNFIMDNDLRFRQNQYDALVCMAFLRRIPSELKDLILQKNIENDLYGDYETQFFEIVLNDFKSLSSFDKYGAGWTNRLKNEVDVYFRNDYSKNY